MQIEGAVPNTDQRIDGGCDENTLQQEIMDEEEKMCLLNSWMLLSLTFSPSSGRGWGHRGERIESDFEWCYSCRSANHNLSNRSLNEQFSSASALISRCFDCHPSNGESYYSFKMAYIVAMSLNLILSFSLLRLMPVHTSACIRCQMSASHP